MCVSEQRESCLASHIRAAVEARANDFVSVSLSYAQGIQHTQPLFAFSYAESLTLYSAVPGLTAQIGLTGIWFQAWPCVLPGVADDGGSTSRSAKFVVVLKIDGWNPIAAAVRIARAHYIDAIEVAVSLDGHFVTVVVTPTIPRTDVREEETSNPDCDVSKGRMKSFSLPILGDLAFP